MLMSRRGLDEMAINAAKYRPLAQSDGCVRVWRALAKRNKANTSACAGPGGPD
jgi:hypothetical protein